ncbi:hypothetical protein J0X19_11730 [Hymenobacter sp. BT186]|uniref:Uncharacterized protein n=1 Tax=Hymenobacter telluris TaxID=2816474 RepID=A0A939JDR2_9BACT|nr:hypothetical protein [Hymenobacter telluris]MBO0358617.1 hypothetical protein [Hymenobacter telluris]MBW3374643.1 hypothetical protein [Hymenobacter norwichensis]
MADRVSIPRIKVIRPKQFDADVVRRKMSEQIGESFQSLKDNGKEPTGFAYVIFSDEPASFGHGYHSPDERSIIDMPDMVRSRLQFAIDKITNPKN